MFSVVVEDDGDFPERDGDCLNKMNVYCEPLKKKGTLQQEGDSS